MQISTPPSTTSHNAAQADAAQQNIAAEDQVVFDNVCKYFGDVPAVDRLSMGIRGGEFFTLLGPSGSGKTTTLRLLAGLEAASSGDIRINGKSVTGVVPEKRNIGLVFQHYALFPHMSVRANVGFPLKMRKVASREISARVDEVLRLTQLTEYARRYPRQLSGGQQQRVALARAFVYDPSILLMDEPLGALDRALRDRMRLELKTLQRRIGATVLYVTHDQDEALSMSDRVGIMHQGVLLQVATPEEMYQRPVNSFVANFLGASVSLPATRVSRGALSELSVEGIDAPVRVSSDNDVCGAKTGIVMIRPENFSITDADPAGDGSINVAAATLESTVYLGSDRQLLLRTDGGARIDVRVESNAPQRPSGTRVWAKWRPEHTRFLPVVD